VFPAVKSTSSFIAPPNVAALGNCKSGVERDFTSLSLPSIAVNSVAVDPACAGRAIYAAIEARLEAWSRFARGALRSRCIRRGVTAPGATDSKVWPAETTLECPRVRRWADIASAIRALFAEPTSSDILRLTGTPTGGAF
jgi:hypothetical protein